MKTQTSGIGDISLADILDRVVERLAAEKRASFADLVLAAGLDPGRDFVGASLAKLDLSGEDLRGFDFTNADLSGADFSQANVTGVSFRGANVSGTIGLALSAQAPKPEPPAKPEMKTVKRMVLWGEAIPEIGCHSSVSYILEKIMTFAISHPSPAFLRSKVSVSLRLV